MESLLTLKARTLNRIMIRGIELYVAVLVLFIIFQHSSASVEAFLKWPLIPMGALLLAYCFWNYRIDKRVITAMIIYVALVLASGAFYGDVNIYIVATTVFVFFPTALFFLGSKNLTLWFWDSFLLIISVALFYKMYNSPDGYMLFYATSRNYVSVYSMLALSICSFAIYRNNAVMPFTFLFIVFFLSVYSVGRGGILATGTMLGLFFFYRVFKAEGKNRQLRITVALIMLIGLSLFIISYNEIILNRFFIRFVDSNATGSNNERLAILRTYFEGVFSSPIQKVLFGIRPIDLGGPFIRVGWNIHNSYLQFYATTGLIGIATLVVLIIRGSYYLYKQRRLEELFILLAFLLRSGTDYLFPGNVGDIVLMYYLFLPWQDSLLDR